MAPVRVALLALGALWTSLAVPATAQQPMPDELAYVDEERRATTGVDDAPAGRDRAVIMALGFGAPSDQQLDDVLASLGYDGTFVVHGGDVAAAARVGDWLWLGGRGQLRGRDWGNAYGPSAAAVGLAALATADARLTLGASAEMGLAVGVGGGGVSLRVGDATEVRAAPAAFAGLTLASKLGAGAWIFGRFSYEYFQVGGFDELTVSLSGAALAFGVEVRP